MSRRSRNQNSPTPTATTAPEGQAADASDTGPTSAPADNGETVTVVASGEETLNSSVPGGEATQLPNAEGTPLADPVRRDTEDASLTPPGFDNLPGRQQPTRSSTTTVTEGDVEPDATPRLGVEGEEQGTEPAAAGNSADPTTPPTKTASDQDGGGDGADDDGDDDDEVDDDDDLDAGPVASPRRLIALPFAKLAKVSGYCKRSDFSLPYATAEKLNQIWGSMVAAGGEMPDGGEINSPEKALTVLIEIVHAQLAD